MGMFRICFETCLRCWSAYLGWRELPAAAGQLGLEAEICKVSRWSKIANTATGIVISSANQLFMKGK